MQYNPNNEELKTKLEEWGKDEELFKSEYESFIKEKIENKEGLEYFDLMFNVAGSNTDSDMVTLGKYGSILKLVDSNIPTKWALQKYFELFNQMSDTPFEPLTIATIIRDSINPETEEGAATRVHWDRVVSGLYKEAHLPEKAYEAIQHLVPHMNTIEKASTLLFSDIPDLIEQGKELVNEIDCDSLYETKDPALVSVGSMKFYSGKNKDGLIHHFGGEDFRPPELVSKRVFPNHKTVDFSGKSVVVTTYRGMGDSMILSRFIPRFLQKYPGVKLSIATERPLVPLYKNMQGVHHVGDLESCVGMFFDYCLGVNHLARYLREDLVDESGKTTAYDWVSYKPVYDEKWSHIQSDWIGVNWKSSQRLGGTGNGVRSAEKYTGRDIDYKEFSVIFDSFPDKTFVVLNPDLSQEELADIEFRKNVIVPEIKDFGDTAAIIAKLHSVVSVDTSISTLSASMHKKTVVMAKFWCDYRWMYSDLWWNKNVATVYRKDKHNASWVLPLFNTIKWIKDNA